MTITIDDKSGFCFGVVRAIEQAEAALAEGGAISCLGDIVHNDSEVERLKRAGMHTITHDQIARIGGGRLLVRAHGEPPSTYRMAREAGVEVIDATCPVVARLQQLVVEADRAMQQAGGRVVIFGKRGHAEVIGLTGQIDDRAEVIESIEEAEQLSVDRPVWLLSQTTQSEERFEQITRLLQQRSQSVSMVTVSNTICRRVADRERHLDQFARRFDVVIFVSGAKSSNGRILFEVAHRANPHSYRIERAEELRAEWFEGCTTVGICGATSTPKREMEQTATHIAALDRQH